VTVKANYLCVSKSVRVETSVLRL